MAATALCLTLLLWISAVSCQLDDFVESIFDAQFIYHDHHNLLLTIMNEQGDCYFTHVDASTKQALQNCHRTFLEQELYDRISWNHPSVRITTLDKMRTQFGDLLADHLCTGLNVYKINYTFGRDYIEQCQTAIGK